MYTQKLKKMFKFIKKWLFFMPIANSRVFISVGINLVLYVFNLLIKKI